MANEICCSCNSSLDEVFPPSTQNGDSVWSFAPPRRVPEATFSARLAVHCVPSCGSRPSESDEMKYVLVSTGSMCICRPASAGQYQRFSEVAARSRWPRNDGLGTNWLDMVARRLLNNPCCPHRNCRIPLISCFEPVGIPGVSGRSPRQSRCELSASWFDSVPATCGGRAITTVNLLSVGRTFASMSDLRGGFFDSFETS